MYVHSVLSSTNLSYSAVQLQLQITICGKAKKRVQFFKKKRRSYPFLIGSLSVIFWDFRTEKADD